MGDDVKKKAKQKQKEIDAKRKVYNKANSGGRAASAGKGQGIGAFGHVGKGGCPPKGPTYARKKR